MRQIKFKLMIGGNVYSEVTAPTVKDAWRKIRAIETGICGIVSPHLKQSMIYLVRGNNSIETVTGYLIES